MTYQHILKYIHNYDDGPRHLFLSYTFFKPAYMGPTNVKNDGSVGKV